jgi:hypothetical protein
MTHHVIDRLFERLRAQLKRDPRHFPTMTRDEFDLYFADIEAGFQHDIADVVREEVAEALAEVEADREYEAWRKAMAKKAKHAKPQVDAETGGAS